MIGLRWMSSDGDGRPTGASVGSSKLTLPSIDGRIDWALSSAKETTSEPLGVLPPSPKSVVRDAQDQDGV